MRIMAELVFSKMRLLALLYNNKFFTNQFSYLHFEIFHDFKNERAPPHFGGKYILMFVLENHELNINILFELPIPYNLVLLRIIY